jgi:hypothetical protein
LADRKKIFIEKSFFQTILFLLTFATGNMANGFWLQHLTTRVTKVSLKHFVDTLEA